MIRLATQDDVDQLAELDLLLFGEYAINEGTFRRELTVDSCWVVEDVGDRIIAYALTREQDGLMDLLRLGVEPGQQNQGLGSKLLHTVLEAASGDVMLTVRVTNYRALALYRRHGFQFVAKLSDAWIMKRPAKQKGSLG